MGGEVSKKFAELHVDALEWVSDHAGERSTGYVDLTPFAEDHGMDGQGAFALLRFCVERGSLDDEQRSLGNPEARLTPEGAGLVEARQRARADPVLRAAAARRGVLTWLWRQKHEGVHMPVVQGVLIAAESMFEGERLQLDEIDRASAYLKSKGLIEGVGAWGREGLLRAHTTAEGDDCAEHYGGDVSEYERRHDQASGPVFHIGNNSGNIAANSRDFTMNASTVNGVDPAAIVMFARAVRQAAPVLGLPETEAEELLETADRLESEAGDGDPDPTRVQRWGGTAIGILNSPVVSGALGSVLASYGLTVLPGV
ncbi:hypothetical protein [Actinomadura sp. NTSP31]|uniref:hypothetical protein n=1 Tax=Actinomadura sp. NTSP31 TaxID=1735447 RepID=UPI0035C235E5